MTDPIIRRRSLAVAEGGPSFSVVVSCFNYAAFVCEAVDSALGQTLAPHEVIVVNDGSTDDTKDRLAARYGGDPRVQVINQPNLGQLAAFLHGCRAASGDVVCFLDADDLWADGYLDALRTRYQGHHRPDMVLCNLDRFGSESGPRFRRKKDRFLGQNLLPAMVLHRFQDSPTSSVSMRRELATQVLKLPEEWFSQWKVRADDVLLIGANLLGGKSLTMAEALVRYRLHGGNNFVKRPRTYRSQAEYAMRLSSVAAYFCARTHLGPGHLHYAFLEFKTRREATLSELCLYLWLQWRAPRPWTHKIRPSMAMLKHFFGFGTESG